VVPVRSAISLRKTTGPAIIAYAGATFCSFAGLPKETPAVATGVARPGFAVIFFCRFYAFSFFNGKFSASARWAASGELATLRTEFLPPNGLGTVSLASGSGIHCPSTTRQYS